jgi:hypothetical protein
VLRMVYQFFLTSTSNSNRIHHGPLRICLHLLLHNSMVLPQFLSLQLAASRWIYAQALNATDTVGSVLASVYSDSPRLKPYDDTECLCASCSLHKRVIPILGVGQILVLSRKAQSAQALERVMCVILRPLTV